MAHWALGTGMMYSPEDSTEAPRTSEVVGSISRGQLGEPSMLISPEGV